MNEPGVYRSDVPGHLLVLKLKPTRVTCIACMETCDCSAYKTRELRPAVTAFVAKHGALDSKIADSILQLVPSQPRTLRQYRAAMPDDDLREAVCASCYQSPGDVPWYCAHCGEDLSHDGKALIPVYGCDATE